VLKDMLSSSDQLEGGLCLWWAHFFQFPSLPNFSMSSLVKPKDPLDASAEKD
jgi:hypothetical protein